MESYCFRSCSVAFSLTVGPLKNRVPVSFIFLLWRPWPTELDQNWKAELYQKEPVCRSYSYSEVSVGRKSSPFERHPLGIRKEKEGPVRLFSHIQMPTNHTLTHMQFLFSPRDSKPDLNRTGLGPSQVRHKVERSSPVSRTRECWLTRSQTRECWLLVCHSCIFPSRDFKVWERARCTSELIP